jgi:hypothetical protein
MAGVLALINQMAGSSQGNPNAVLYGLAAKLTCSSCSAETATNAGGCLFRLFAAVSVVEAVFILIV